MLQISLATRQAGSTRSLFVALFWIHNVLFGSASGFIAMELLLTGKAQGVINAIALALMWIGGSITFGIAALMHGETQAAGTVKRPQANDDMWR